MPHWIQDHAMRQALRCLTRHRRLEGQCGNELWFVLEQQAKLLLSVNGQQKNILNKIKDVAKEISMPKCNCLLLVAYNKIWKKIKWAKEGTVSFSSEI